MGKITPFLIVVGIAVAIGVVLKSYKKSTPNPTITVGKNPTCIAISENNVYVVNSGDNSVSVIDTTNNKLLEKPIVVGSYPEYIAISGNYAYVANYGGNTVNVIDISGYK